MDEDLMTKNENRCANCGGKFGLVSYQHWGLRFCRRACKNTFLARSSKDHARVRKWFGFLGRVASDADRGSRANRDNWSYFNADGAATKHD